MSQPYVVLVVAPSSGVGQSTLASNLAVYLKGLDEELPVAFCSADSERMLKMFSLQNPQPGALTELSEGAPLAEVLSWGEFGVEICRAGDLPPDAAPNWLRKRLGVCGYDGILLLDLDHDHRLLTAAVWAADLLLAPVKDPASLGQLVRLRKELRSGLGRDEQLWVLPSEVGAAGAYQESARQQDFLRFAAEERGFQVLDEVFVADQQVREQAAALAKPVLTRAAQSSLHGQLRQLAELIRDQRQQQAGYAVRLARLQADRCLPQRARRVELCCPLCQKDVLGCDVHYLEAYPARKRMLLHGSCVDSLLEATQAGTFLPTAECLLIQAGAAHGGRAGQLLLKTLDAEFTQLSSESCTPGPAGPWQDLLGRATGRCLAELYQELLLLSRLTTVEEALSSAWYRQFVALRQELRRACIEEKI